MTEHSSESQSTHEVVFAELGAYALGALDTADASRIEKHAAGCAICLTEIAELRSVLKEMPAASALGTMDPQRSNDIRSRLVARTATGTGTGAGIWRLMSLAAGLALVATGWGYARERSKRNEVEQLYTQHVSETNKLQADLRDKESRLAAITGPDVSVMEMSATGVNAPTARMFWDRATNRWTVFAHGLATPKPGRAYELWLVTANQKIPAGVFKPGEDGSAVFTATYALKLEDLKAIAVTEEPEAGVPAPTGAIVLLGSAAPGT